jgi:hypothetical protein
VSKLGTIWLVERSLLFEAENGTAIILISLREMSMVAATVVKGHMDSNGHLQCHLKLRCR